MTKPLRLGECRRVYADLSNVQTNTLAPAGATWSQMVAVREACPPGACYTPAPLGGLTLFLTLRGRTELEVDGRTFLHQSGAMMAVASDCSIREQVALGEIWWVCYLQLQGAWAEQMNVWLRRQDVPVREYAAVPTRSRQMFAEMVDLVMEQSEGWAWTFVSRSAELLGYLSSEIPSGEKDVLLVQLARILDSSPAERMSVQEMAAVCSLTPRQLLYQFHKAAGEPLAQWIRKRRIGTARQLLGQGQSVTEVSERLGFANPYHFSRTFKSLTGISPSHFRANALQGILHPDEPER